MVSDVVIAGAGIGGLTLAVALGRRGVRVTVIERARELHPAGAGLGLAPNAMKVLAGLGLADATAAAGAKIARSALLDARGRLIGEFDVSRLGESLGAPAVALHRARLHDVLIKAVGPGVVRTGTAIVSYEQRSDSVTVICAAGERIETELLVGADGLHSKVRARLVGSEEPAYSGYTSWRGVTPPHSIPVPTRMTESWGHGERFGIVNIGFGEIYWFAVANAAPGGRDRDVRGELLARFGGWHEPIRSIIEATPATEVLRTDISDREPIESWHDGRVVLLGDAAHPMTPNLGQGAGQAIEDAVVLDQCLANDDGMEHALRTYERRRVARANSIVRASRFFGAVAQWRNPVAAWVRDTGMRLMPAWFNMAQARKLIQAEL